MNPLDFDIGIGTGLEGMDAIQMASDDCTHPINFGNMCGVCGVYLSDEQISNSAPMTHDGDGVKVSVQEAKRLDTESTAHLLSQRKLALVIDLDQTIIHATVDRSVGEFMNDESNPNHEVLKDVGKFYLGGDGKEIIFEDEEESKGSKGKGKGKGKAKDESQDEEQEAPKENHSTAERIRRATLLGGMFYYVKPRPGLQDFLTRLSQKYQLHVYTMGTRAYADCVCKLIDKEGKFFGNRILSRDESGSMLRKSLGRLFNDTSMVVAIDDRADVWEWSPNLVKVIPYTFFPATGDINGAFLPPVPEAPTGALPSPPPSEPSSDSSASNSNSTLSSGSVSQPASSSTNSPPLTTAGDGVSSTSTPLGNGDGDSVTEKQAQSQKITLNEQRENRPLARMQKAKDEKLKTEGTSSSSEEAGSSISTSSSTSEKSESGTETLVAGEVKSEKEQTKTTDGEGGDVAQAEDEDDGDQTMSPDSTAGPSVDLNEIAATTRAVLSNDDWELDRLEKILTEVHSRWYLEWDSVETSRSNKGQKKSPSTTTTNEKEMIEAAMRPKPKVEDIIGSLKAAVFRGCGIVFSSMWTLESDPVYTDVWRMAEDFGAKCYLQVNKSVTHIVAARSDTEKVNVGQIHRSISVVSPSWFNESIANWERLPEEPHLLPISEETSRSRNRPSPELPDAPIVSASDEAADRMIMAALVEEDLGGEENGESHLAGMGMAMGGNGQGREVENSQDEEEMAEFAWDDAAAEVDAFLSDDDDDDEDTDAGYGTDASNRSRSGLKSLLPKSNVKRARYSTSSSTRSRNASGASTDNEGEDGGNLDNQNKRRRLVKDKSKSSFSKLKQSQTMDDENDDAGGSVGSSKMRGKRRDNGDQTVSELRDEDGDQMPASQDTDGSEIDQSFLRQLEDDLELQLGEDDDD